MKKILRKSSILLVIALLVGIFVVPIASAQLIQPGDVPESIAGATGGESDVKVLVRTIVDYFLAFLGFLATIMIIYGGILYVTAAGNQENADKGKKLIMYAVVGIIIILLSYAIVSTVLQAPTGTGTT